MDNADFETGLAKRREVLGLCSTSAAPPRDRYLEAFDELEAEYMWGMVWSRPGLDSRTRCMLQVAMLVALNRSAELPVFIRAALHNGCSREEITEVLLQANVCCGGPAGNDAARIAREVFAESARP